MNLLAILIALALTLSTCDPIIVPVIPTPTAPPETQISLWYDCNMLVPDTQTSCLVLEGEVEVEVLLTNPTNQPHYVTYFDLMFSGEPNLLDVVSYTAADPFVCSVNESYDSWSEEQMFAISCGDPAAAGYYTLPAGGSLSLGVVTLDVNHGVVLTQHDTFVYDETVALVYSCCSIGFPDLPVYPPQLDVIPLIIDPTLTPVP